MIKNTGKRAHVYLHVSDDKRRPLLFSTNIVTMILILAVCVLYAANSAAQINVGGCGQTTYKHIVGGAEVPANEHPWMVALKRRGSFICGASLIQGRSGRLYVLTAAHCTAGSNANQLTVEFGRHDLSNSNEQSAQYSGVARIIDHENYNSNSLANDISILELTTPPSLNSYVSPICVAEDQKPDGSDAEVIGWGTLTEGGSLPSKLHGVVKPILTNSKCSQDLGSGFLSASMLCAGFDEGGADACQGDSGGPLMYYRPARNRMDIIGIVSWGYGCARPYRPGVYADVFNLRNWISSKIN